MNLNGTLDVTELESIDEKISACLRNNAILKYFQEFEYKKKYRHFCYFKCSQISPEIIEALAKTGGVKVYDKNECMLVDEYERPSLFVSENTIYLKYSYKLNNEFNKHIKYTVICILDLSSSILELRFDRVGIAYKNSYTFYKEKIDEILVDICNKFNIVIDNYDFKAVVDYIKAEKDDITIYAQKMNRNGTTAYLEAFDSGDSIMPILGELNQLISDKREYFDKDENTITIRNILETFIKDIELKSDMPVVKVRMDDRNIKFGITHNYKGSDYSLFMMYEDLTGGKEDMTYVREYLSECCKELDNCISSD